MVEVEPQVDLTLVLDMAKEHHDEGYARFICKFPFSYYVERVKRIGFVGRQCVIDVGCGFGQWTTALALLNHKVVALEQNLARLSIARELARRSGITNVEFVLGDALSVLDREDETFDALFCYGVFMFLDRRRAVAEFARILKPDGEIYICTNAFGWWLQLWLKHWFSDRQVRQAAYRAMTGGNKGGLPNYTNRGGVADVLPPEEWDVLQVGYEGTLSRFSNGANPEPAYRGTFLGLDSVIEFLARKKAANAVNSAHHAMQNERCRDEAAALIHRLVERTLARNTYEYITPLPELPQPRPADDLVNNCFRPLVHEALALSRSLRRVEQLQLVFQKITEGCRSQIEQIRACVTFAQMHFFHHFAGQPMQAENIPVLDPLAALILRSGRCGNVARFLVDLFECNGFPARLLTGGCHTSAEVLWQARWILADASLFPPGVSPVDDSGNPVGIEQAARSPELLDRCQSYINYHHEYVEAFLKAYPETTSALDRYLRAPLLPSAAFFGAEYFPGRPPGHIQRLRKQGSPTEWNADENFGWFLGYQCDTMEGPASLSRQRPGQVTRLDARQGDFCWERPYCPDKEMRLLYRVIINERSRGWSYRQIPVGCMFAVSGTTMIIEDTSVPQETLLNLGRYLTIVTQVREWNDEQIFYLPSREFDLRDRTSW
ncbi:MAG: methyltransferase domain-containing protein [Nitrospira sp.]|nr:methyltransferase domain-containing protein [Nitrospira sp.]